MKVFKVVFARNEVVLCKESSVRLPKDIEIRYEQNNGHLIYAFVQASDMTEAVVKAKQLIPHLAPQLINQRSGDPSSSG
jgi:hypothetical protein